MRDDIHLLQDPGLMLFLLTYLCGMLRRRWTKLRPLAHLVSGDV